MLTAHGTHQKKVEAKFNEYVKEAHFGSVRYPGGTVSNLFDWKRSIGPCRAAKETITWTSGNI